jgi:hypothetical protein
MDWSNRWVWIGFGGAGILILTILVLMFKKLCYKFNNFGIIHHVSSNESLASLSSNIEINIIKSNGEIEMTSINPMKTPTESNTILQHQRSRRITNI